MKLLMAGLLAFSSAAFAASIAPLSYHDGTLVSYSMQAFGGNCTTSPEQSCNDDYAAQYTVKSEGILYALTPVSAASGGFVERAAFGWSKAFSKYSSLYRQQPGTTLQLREDGKHFFVKVGNRESMYEALDAR